MKIHPLIQSHGQGMLYGFYYLQNLMISFFQLITIASHRHGIFKIKYLIELSTQLLVNNS